MINMKCEKEEMMKNEYSYGLCIRLDKENMEKLGIKEMPKLGETMMIQAKLAVSSISESEHNKSLELQITDMEILKSTAEVMYKK